MYHRDVLQNLLRYLNQPEILLLVGARQVGKTTIMKMLIESLRRQGEPESAIHYLDLEDMNLLHLLEGGPRELIGWLGAQGANLSRKVYIFIDEIQYLSNPSNLLKLLSDSQANLKLIVSGSSTLEIRRKFTDSLAGRKLVFEIYPLNFAEFLDFRGEPRLAKTVRECGIRLFTPDSDPAALTARYLTDECGRYYREFLIWGGYPRVALEADEQRKTAYMAELYNSYVRKDIKDLARIDNVTGFNNLITALAHQTGGLANISELATATRLARNTVENFLFLLENTFIIKGCMPFSRNPRKEISKMRKYYFIDNGMRNIAIRNLAALDNRTDAGELAENAVYAELLKKSPLLEEIAFWRTQSKNEVDFVLNNGGKLRPIEVKYRPFKVPKKPAGIRSFLLDYPEAEQSLVLTRDFFGVGDDVRYVPCWLA
ncbi:MAG: ATP-binding protein [Syntrophobacterales bacterium]|nr:ATP-binding protein [Syntrophobacterales bacterium]